MKNKGFLKFCRDGERFSGYARVLRRRDFGKISFWMVRFKESELQLLLQEGVVSNYREVIKIPLGSLIFLEGEKVTTKAGEPSIAVKVIRVEKAGNEIVQNKLGGINHLSRSGNRVLDIMTSRTIFDYLLLLSHLSSSMRAFLRDSGFREFTTGILQDYFEGGAAEPFQTQHRQSGKSLYLSLTSELKLKRLMVAGFEKVYEISQSFRNEGIDKMHLPEFSLLELYAVNQDYRNMMSFLESMLSEIILKNFDTYSLNVDGGEVSFKPPFARKTFNDMCLGFLGVSEEECNAEWLAKRFPEMFHEGMDEFTWVVKLVDKVFTPNLTNPTFLVDVPFGISPFAKRHPDNIRLSESAFFIASGINMATISTDENDVEKIATNLAKQSKRTGRPINKKYLDVLELGLPPSAGIGFGLNRFFMLFQQEGKSARETCPLSVF